MADIEELQRRLTAAIDRIAKGVDRLDAAAAPAADPEEIEELRSRLAAAEEALGEERIAGSSARRGSARCTPSSRMPRPP